MTYVDEETNQRNQVFRDLSFKVEDGEFVFLTGASGCGKSTVIKLLLREMAPTIGEIVVNGSALARMKPSEIPRYRRGLGIVFQDFRLMQDRTVYENIELARLAIGGTRKDAHLKIAKLLQLLGLSNLHRRYPGELSGGEQQRVCLARALVNNPQLLLADEPTANLDPDNAKELLRLFQVAHSQGITVVVATQDDVLKENAEGVRELSLEDLCKEKT